MDIGGYVNKNSTRLYSYPHTSVQHSPLTPQHIYGDVVNPISQMGEVK